MAEQQDPSIASNFSQTLQLGQWLEKYKLECYFESFIEKGYDDFEEIVEMSENVLHQLAIDVGMVTKPNHVRRLTCAVATSKADVIFPPVESEKPVFVKKSRWYIHLENHVQFRLRYNVPFTSCIFIYKHVVYGPSI